MFNETSDKYATLLCTAKKLKDRVRVLCKLLEIAEFSKEIGNFNGFMEVYSTLQRGPIRRLKKTFAVCTCSVILTLFSNFSCMIPSSICCSFPSFRLIPHVRGAPREGEADV